MSTETKLTPVNTFMYGDMIFTLTTSNKGGRYVHVQVGRVSRFYEIQVFLELVNRFNSFVKNYQNGNSHL